MYMKHPSFLISLGPSDWRYINSVHVSDWDSLWWQRLQVRSSSLCLLGVFPALDPSLHVTDCLLVVQRSNSTCISLNQRNTCFAYDYLTRNSWKKMPSYVSVLIRDTGLRKDTLSADGSEPPMTLAGSLCSHIALQHWALSIFICVF